MKTFPSEMRDRTIRLAFFQPDIPQNLGGVLRLAACFRVPVEVIEPCAFPLSDRGLKRAALDYSKHITIAHRSGWAQFIAAMERFEGRLILFTTKGETPYLDFDFQPGDTLLFGQESAGAPDFAHDAAWARLVVPIAPEARSLNVVTTAAMALGEALRQTRAFPFAGISR